MPKYEARPTQVDALCYAGQTMANLPQWAHDHQGVHELGASKIGRTMTGELLVPSRGTTVTCRQGDYLVLDNGVVSVVKAAWFESHYICVDVEDEPEVVEMPAPKVASEDEEEDD